MGRLTEAEESQLSTHDLFISIGAQADPRSGGAVAGRQLRVLFFSSSATTNDKLSDTVERIRRFASLTGGQNLAIVMLLEAETPAILDSTKTPEKGEITQTSSEAGVLAYSKLQATMMDHPEIPYIPILPLAKLDSITELLRKHVAYLSRPKQKSKPASTSFALLQLCTANPPMSQHTSYVVSDLFANLRELAAACTTVSSTPNSSSPSVRAAGFSTQMTGTQASGIDEDTQRSDDRAVAKLKQLRDLVGERECADVVDFWKEEWTID